MSDLKPRTRALLDLGRAGDDPTDADMAENRRSLTARLGAAALAGGATAVSSTTASAAALGSAMKIAVVFSLAVTGAMATVIVTRRPAPAVPSLASSAVSSAAIEPTAPVPPAPAPGPLPAPGDGVRTTDGVVAAPRASTSRGLKEELDLLREAQEDLHAGRPSQALERLAEHARKFPRGALWEEREASRVLALCQLGNVAAAHAQAERFIRRAPDSPFVERVRDACR